MSPLRKAWAGSGRSWGGNGKRRGPPEWQRGHMSWLPSLAAQGMGTLHPHPRAWRGRLVPKGLGVHQLCQACRSPARAAAQARLGVRVSRTASDSWSRGQQHPGTMSSPGVLGAPHPGSKAQDMRPPSVSILTSCVIRACYPSSETRFLVCLQQGHRDTAITRHRLGEHRKQCQAHPPGTGNPAGFPGAPQDTRGPGSQQSPIQARPHAHGWA